MRVEPAKVREALRIAQDIKAHVDHHHPRIVRATGGPAKADPGPDPSEDPRFEPTRLIF